MLACMEYFNFHGRVFAYRCGLLIFTLFLFVPHASAQAKAQAQAPAPALKTCPGGPTLKASAGLAPQGSLILVQVVAPKGAPNYTSDWGGEAVPLWQEQGKTALHGLIGVDLEKAPGKYEWKVSWPGADGKTQTCSLAITVRAGKFPTEKLTVENQFVHPDPEQEKKVEEDGKKTKAIYDTVTPERLWNGAFRMPLKDVTTGRNFGRRRVLNGEARSPHAGVDLPAMTGTPVFASQAGKVVLAENLFYAGNVIIIDHGYGIYTMYAHLSEIGVKPDQMVKAGEEIGKVGATGRVTGPHLHWGLTINHARVNAMLIAQHDP
jgi:murein DD-endopeptidase MepM/ murein hydrolase activator NlpD